MRLPRLKEWREFRGFTQPELAERAGLSLRTVFNYEHGGNALPNNARKLAETLEVEIGDLLSVEAHPKVTAPRRSPGQPRLNGFEDERDVSWRRAAAAARRSREAARLQMENLLARWRASKQRGEGPSERRRYLDQMGDLLRHADEAAVSLFVEAGKWADESSFVEKFREVQQADRFYFELRDYVLRAGLTISAPPGGASEAQDASEGSLVEGEMRPGRVEEKIGA